jgi:hypothetical protein
MRVHFQLAPMPLRKSARNSLEKIVGKKPWEATTVNLNLEPSVVSCVAQMSLVPTENHITPAKSLKHSAMTALTNSVTRKWGW